jgi:hypothetical protein
LRWYDATENWIPTEVELERAKIERLTARLKELGINPEE